MMGLGFIIVVVGAFMHTRFPPRTEEGFGRRDLSTLAVLLGAILMGAAFAR